MSSKYDMMYDLPDLDCVLEDVPGAGGGDVLCDGGVVPHHKEAQLVLVDSFLVAVVRRLFRLKINIALTFSLFKLIPQCKFICSLFTIHQIGIFEFRILCSF